MRFLLSDGKQYAATMRFLQSAREILWALPLLVRKNPRCDEVLIQALSLGCRALLRTAPARNPTSAVARKG